MMKNDGNMYVFAPCFSWIFWKEFVDDILEIRKIKIIPDRVHGEGGERVADALEEGHWVSGN